ncbi:TBC LysM-associated domain containing 2 [Gurleya vavrai]
MNFFKRFFKRKKKNEPIQTIDVPLPSQIMNFKYLHNHKTITPRIITNYFKLKCVLEAKYQICESWSLAYSTFCHGYSLRTMHFFLSNYKGPFLFVVQEPNGNVFGCFFEESVEVRKQMFGCKSTFLYKIEKEKNQNDENFEKEKNKFVEKKYVEKELNETKYFNDKKFENDSEKINFDNYFEHGDRNFNYKVKIYKASNKNDFFCTSSTDFLAFGCGNGFYGLLLNNNLQSGESHFVDTFENEVLASNSKFSISELEIWQLNM